jgi:putative peptidoglycan lipid II flippase
MQELILGIFAVSIGTVLLPDLAGHAKSLSWNIFTERLLQAMKIIALITIPITFFFMAAGENLIRLLFQARNFTEESVRLTLGAFMFHMPGLFFIALNRILAPAFYAQSDSKSPTIAGLVSFGVNITAALALAPGFKGSGIALALTLASAVNTVFLLLFLKKNPAVTLGRIIGPVVLYSIKIIVFSAAALIPIVFLKNPLLTFFAGSNRVISLGLPLFILGLIYGVLGLALLALTGDRQMRAVLNTLRRSKKVNDVK